MASSIAPEAVIPTEAALLAFALLVASGRLVPRCLQQQYPNVSDSFLIASILNASGLFITDTLTYVWGGMAEEDTESSISRIIELKKAQFAGNAFYDTGIYFPKLAILALYFRLIPHTMPWLRKALYAVSIFTTCAMVTTFLLDTFWCGRRVSLNWSPEEGACNTFSSKEVFRIDWAANVTTDILRCTVFALPFPLLRNLQLNKQQIWGLIATFGLGGVTVSMSVVRFATIEVIHAWTNVYVLSMAEMAVAIIVVSLPSMRSYLRSGTLFSSSSRRSQKGYAGSRDLMSSDRRGKNMVSVRSGDDEGSQVELNNLARSDVIYETTRVSVQFEKERW